LLALYAMVCHPSSYLTGLLSPSYSRLGTPGPLGVIVAGIYGQDALSVAQLLKL